MTFWKNFRKTLSASSTNGNFRILWKDSGELVAVRQISGLSCSELITVNKEFTQEVKKAENLTELQKRLVRCKASFIYNESLFVVSEYFANGSLHDLISKCFKQTGRGLSEAIVQILVKDLAETIALLHASGRLLWEISLTKLFISPGGELKLQESSDCKFYTEMRGKSRSVKAKTPAFVAPETVRSGVHKQSSDVWSLGILATTLVDGEFPFRSRGLSLALEIAEWKEPSSSKKEHSSELSAFLLMCLRPEPSKRASLTELLESEFLLRAHNRQFLLRNIFSRKSNASKSLESMKRLVRESRFPAQSQGRGNSCVGLLPCQAIELTSDEEEKNGRGEKCSAYFIEKKLMRKMHLLDSMKPFLLKSIFSEINQNLKFTKLR